MDAVTAGHEDDPLGTMTIGEFARHTNLTPRALRLYEEQGVLLPHGVDPANGYRTYVAGQVSPARLVALLRGLEMSLADIRSLLAEGVTSDACTFDEWWRQRERLHTGRRRLAGHVRSILHTEEPDMYQIRLRHVDAARVLTVQRRVTQPQLDGFIADTIRTFTDVVGDVSAPAFPYTLVYHGKVSADEDGPVEALVGAPSGVDACAAFGVRFEPAHDEAYTTITKAQLEFPEILGAYDAVACSELVGERGLGELSCREVYPYDMGRAGDDDPVCDVAFPLRAPG